MAKFSVYCLLISITCLSCATPERENFLEIKSPEPETVFVLHGLGRSAFAMNAIVESLQQKGYRVHNLSYSSLGKSIGEMVQEVNQKIAAAAIPRGEKVHFVGHSLGGLLIRAVLAGSSFKHLNLGNVVLIASPNKGTPIAEKYRDSFWVSWLLPATLELGTGVDSFPNRLPPPDYNLGVIAGTVGYNSTDDVIPGLDDGIVGIESTKVDKMSDFIAVNANHSRLRRFNPVLSQIANFIKRGSFNIKALNIL